VGSDGASPSSFQEHLREASPVRAGRSRSAGQTTLNKAKQGNYRGAGSLAKRARSNCVFWVFFAFGGGFNARLTHNRLFRPLQLLRRSGPVPGILAAGEAGAIVDKSARRYVAVRSGLSWELR